MMNKKSKLPLLAAIGVLFLVTAASMWGFPALSVEKENPASTTAVAKGNTAFALDLYRELKDAGDNLFFSPYSISAALAMTYAGARGNTATQMAEVLHFNLKQEKLHAAFAGLDALLNAVQEEGDIQLSTANALWPQKNYPFREEYLAFVKKHYGVTITPLDYQRETEAARITINRWVKKKTKDKIRNLIQPGVLNALTRLVLTNAIYFKGNWASRFDKKQTKEDTFFLLSGKTVRVPLMTQKNKFAYAENRSLQVLELPYIGDNLSMIVLLPRKTDGLPEIESQLSIESLERWTAVLKKQKVEVFFPRFKMTSQFRMDKTLVSMGMSDAFSASTADFSGMDGHPHWLFIGAVIHKAFVDVNEEGTEAAAATAVVMRIKMAAPTPAPTFRADHPFIFLIRENDTGSILFIGRVLDPTKNEE